MDLHLSSIKELLLLLKNRSVSSFELTQHFYNRIEQIQPNINALISYDKDLAFEAAKQSDQRRSKERSGLLDGIPILQKDLVCSTKYTTTCGSKMLKDYVSPYNSYVVNLCDAAGMIELGKTNMDEFAMGSSNETSYYGNDLNPWEHTKDPGCSSGGSAAAIAARLAPVATGSDTGGSIRQPASFCNLTGLKPTYGAVSRYGLIAFASSLDQIGPMAQTAEDCAYLMNVICRKDVKDSTSKEYNIDFTKELDKKMGKIKVGIPKQMSTFNLNSDVENTFMQTKKSLEKIGAEFVDIDINSFELGLPAY